MSNNITWCGNFIVKSENREIADKLQYASNLLFSEDNTLEDYIKNYSEDLILENQNKKNFSIDFYTFLFFQDYQKYWKVFKSFDKVNCNIILEDLFSRETYLEFDKVEENDRFSFFSDLLTYFNKNLFNNELVIKEKNFTKILLGSYAFKQIFKNVKKPLIIPILYQEIILEKMSDALIFQYNWDGFKYIFNSIDKNVKEKYFNEHSILEYFSPALSLAYSYEYKSLELKYNSKKTIAIVKSNFETFVHKNINLFEKMKIDEQKAIFEIFLMKGRKDLFEYMFKNFNSINKESYSYVEYQKLLLKGKKSILNIDFDKYFLFKSLNQNLQPKYKEKKFKI